MINCKEMIDFKGKKNGILTQKELPKTMFPITFSFSLKPTKL